MVRLAVLFSVASALPPFLWKNPLWVSVPGAGEQEMSFQDGPKKV